MTLTETCETCPRVVGRARLTRGADGLMRCPRCHARRPNEARELEPEREKYDDDGREYADPRDFRAGRE